MSASTVTRGPHVPKRSGKGGYRAASSYIPRDKSGRPQRAARSEERRGAAADGAAGRAADERRGRTRTGAGAASTGRTAAGRGDGSRSRAERAARGAEARLDHRAEARDRRREPLLDRAEGGASRDAGGRAGGAGRSAAPATRKGRQDTASERTIAVGDRVDTRVRRGEDVAFERLDARIVTEADTIGRAFADLGLGDNICATLDDLGAETPFPVQVATIPVILDGRDVLARARTGSGKTIAFGAGIVERLLAIKRDERAAEKAERARGGSGGDAKTASAGARAAADGTGPGDDAPKRSKRDQRRDAYLRRAPKGSTGRAPRALIVAPTRELALQIDRTVQPLARAVGLYTTQVYGGVPQAGQVTALRRGVDIVIGTPGRLEDLFSQGHLDLSRIAVTVLDEADHMCDLGFLEPVQRLMRRTPDTAQRLLYSATLDGAVHRLVREFLRSPETVEIASPDDDVSGIRHRVLVVAYDDRDAVLQQLAGSGGRVLVFARTKLGVDRIVEELADGGIEALPLHGDLSQERRARNLDRFARGRVDVLVATDVAARGIHVDDVRLVVQFDAPEDHKTYLHRAGRTGRAGSAGTVVTLVTPGRRGRIEELLANAGVEAEATPARPAGRELDEFMAVG